MAQPPEKSFRIGACSASVFLNEAAGGRTFRSVVLERRYKQGEEWKSIGSFPLSDLPAAAAVLKLASDYVTECEAAQ